MDITKKGIILAIVRLGSWLGTFTIAGITSDYPQFFLALMVFALINIPQDLYLMNRKESEKTEIADLKKEIERLKKLSGE